jgi:hypothetical protein
MTLIEMVIAVFAIAAALFLLVGWMSSMRSGSRVDLARRMLLELDKSLARYYRACDMFPPIRSADPVADVTVQLLNHERTRPLLDALPESVWRVPGRRVLVDPWGTPLRYHPETSGSPYVRANEGRPVFVSAGPDRDFGDHDRTCVGDNLRSDDPGPEGFRPLLTARDAGDPEK